MIAKYGEGDIELWAKDLVNNFARDPAGGDRDQIKAIAAGIGDIAVVNSYYIINMLNSDDKGIFDSLGIYFPNDEDMGTHFNISGAGLLINGPNPDNGKKLIEFLASDQGQEIYSNINFEYPVVDYIEIPNVLKKLGSFKEDSINIYEYGRLSFKAIKLADRFGWK